MLNKIQFICWLATFVLAVLAVALVSVAGISIVFGDVGEVFDFFGVGMVPVFAGGAVLLAWSAWLAASSLGRLSGDPELMRVLASRLADVTERVADRTRKAASRD